MFSLMPTAKTPQGGWISSAICGLPLNGRPIPHPPPQRTWAWSREGQGRYSRQGTLRWPSVHSSRRHRLPRSRGLASSRLGGGGGDRSTDGEPVGKGHGKKGTLCLPAHVLWGSRVGGRVRRPPEHQNTNSPTVFKPIHPNGDPATPSSMEWSVG